MERPEPHEVVFRDADRQAHARRWTNRQSGLSAVRPATASALIVAEALHQSAAEDIRRLVDALAGELSSLFTVAGGPTELTSTAPRFSF